VARDRIIRVTPNEAPHECARRLLATMQSLALWPPLLLTPQRG